jgi:uncharacterized protein YggE
MGRKAVRCLVSAAMAIALCMGASKNSYGQNPVPATGVAPQFIVNQRAIAVIGQGLATAPADTARLEFRLASRTPSEPSQLETNAAAELGLQPAIDALVKIEVPADNIKVQTSSVENPKLLVSLQKPTRDRLEEVVRVVTSSLTTSDNLFIQGIGAEYKLNNCYQLERTARRAAIRDALEQAKIIGVDLGLKLGDILFVSMFPSFGSAASSTCGSKVGVPVSPLLSLSDTMPPYDPSANPEVQLRIQVSITYAIQAYK